MDEKELKARTKRFALDVIGAVEALPAGATARTIGHQLLRAGMSVGANYSAACRAKSKPDFISKLGIAFEEADECLYWMELLRDARIVPVEKLEALRREADELVAIFHASIKTARTSR